MRNRTSSVSAVAVIGLLLLASAAAAQSESRDRELPNFHQVNERLYRGAQPRTGGFHKLAALGIKAVINLRAADERSRAEEEEARAAGLRYFNAPMEGYVRPTDAQVEHILSLINAPENQPVFVHCKRGADRTGTIIAVYRISHDGWTSESAKAEAKRYGMRWTQIRMKDYIKDYYRQRVGEKDNGSDVLRTQIAGTIVAATYRMVQKAQLRSLMQRSAKQLRRAIP